MNNLSGGDEVWAFITIEGVVVVVALCLLVAVFTSSDCITLVRSINVAGLDVYMVYHRPRVGPMKIIFQSPKSQMHAIVASSVVLFI